MAENNDCNTMANYWKSRYEQEHKRADDNMRLAAERAGEIADLQLTVKELAAYIRIVQEHMTAIKVSQLIGQALIVAEEGG